MKGTALRRIPAVEPVARCGKCGAWTMLDRPCGTCRDLADKVLTSAAWASVGLLHVMAGFLFAAWFVK